MLDQELIDWIMTEPPLLELLLKIQQLIEKKNRWRAACELSCEVMRKIEFSPVIYNAENFYLEAGRNNEQIKTD